MTDVAVEQRQPIRATASAEAAIAPAPELSRRTELGMLVLLIAIEAAWLAAVGALLVYVA